MNKAKIRVKVYGRKLFKGKYIVESLLINYKQKNKKDSFIFKNFGFGEQPLCKNSIRLKKKIRKVWMRV